MTTYREYVLGEAVLKEARAPKQGDYVMSAVGGVGPIRKLTSTIAYVDFNVEGPGSERLAPVSVKDLSPAKVSGASLGLRRRPDQQPFAIWREKWSD